MYACKTLRRWHLQNEMLNVSFQIWRLAKFTNWKPNGMVIPSSKLWRKNEIFKKSFQIKITIAWIEYGMGKHVLTPLFLWWFHLCLREIPARRRFQKEKNVEKYIDISITYFFTFGSNGSEMESQIFAYFFTAECELCALSLWPFWTCEYIKNHKWSSFTSHFFYCNQLN